MIDDYFCYILDVDEGSVFNDDASSTISAPVAPLHPATTPPQPPLQPSSSPHQLTHRYMVTPNIAHINFQLVKGYNLVLHFGRQN